MPFDFPTELANAVARARQYLNAGPRGTLFDPTDNRAAAYLDIATVLRRQAAATGIDRYLQAAYMLEEQAEVTTFSGDNGSLAMLGNFNAKQNGGSRYNVPLDVFSWQIDEAVITFFENVVNNHQYEDISQNSILAVDALVWDSKGLLPYFPGLALGIDFTILSFDHTVWRMSRSQFETLHMSTFGTVDFIQGGGLRVAGAYGHPDPTQLGKRVTQYGFTDAQVQTLPAGGSLTSQSGRWRLSVDEFGRRTVSQVSDGYIAWVDNNNNLASLSARLGTLVASIGTLGAPSLLQGYGEYIIPPGSGRFPIRQFRMTPDGYDRFKDYLGGDLGPGGARFRFGANPELQMPTYEELLALTPGASPSASSYMVNFQRTGTGAATFSEVVTMNWGTGSVLVARDYSVSGQTIVVTGERSVIRDGNGHVVQTNLSEVEQTVLLNLEQLARAQEQLQRFSDATQRTTEANSGEGVGALAGELSGSDGTPAFTGPALGHSTDDDGGLTLTFNDTPRFALLLPIDPVTGAWLPTGLRRVHSPWTSSGEDIVDDLGRHVELTVVGGQIVKSSAWDGLRTGGRGGFGVTVETTYSNGHAVSTNIKINDNPIGIEFSDAGGILGQQLGTLIAGGNVLVGIVTSATLQTLGDSLGDVLDGLVGNQSINHATHDAFKTFGPELLTNLRDAGIGAVSSLLTAELIKALGVEGFAGELLNTAAGHVISTILSNIATGASLFQGISPASIGTAIGSFLGNKLANEVITFDTIGGQIGSAVGSTLAVLAVSLAVGGPPGLVLAAAAAFIGNIIGGTIGSLFGGVPRSGADVAWDSAKGEFVVANVYARKGGSKDSAKGMATVVAETFNNVLAATGGTLMDPGAVQAGNYGMRKSDFVYRPHSTRDKDAITRRFSGEDGATQLISYGILQGLTDADFKIMGGDVVVKRALYNSFASGEIDPDEFDPALVVGNIAIAQHYQSYLNNSTVVNALISAEPDSVFAAEWAVTFARAIDLGLDQRHESDWYGGFSYLLSAAQTNAATAWFEFDYDPYSDKLSRLIGVGEFVVSDMIDVGAQTVIVATDASETLMLVHSATATGRGGDLVLAEGWPDEDGALPAGPATVTGWQNPAGLDDIKWALMAGPDGREATVIEADGGPGGNVTNPFAIDPTKTYEFTFYFQYDANGAGEVGFGLSSGGYVLGHDGQGGDPWFFKSAAAGAGAFETGRWYKVVGYVLPQGYGTSGSGMLGGVFDTVTGDKVADTNSFSWNVDRPDNAVVARFHGHGGAGADDSVYFHRPEVRQVTESVVVGGADRLGNTSGLRIDGMMGDGSSLSIDVAATIDMGAGDDIVHAGDMGNNVFGGAGNDTLYGGLLDDWLIGGDGNDTLNAGAHAARRGRRGGGGGEGEGGGWGQGGGGEGGGWGGAKAKAAGAKAAAAKRAAAGTMPATAAAGGRQHRRPGGDGNYLERRCRQRRDPRPRGLRLARGRRRRRRSRRRRRRRHLDRRRRRRRRQWRGGRRPAQGRPWRRPVSAARRRRRRRRRRGRQRRNRRRADDAGHRPSGARYLGIAGGTIVRNWLGDDFDRELADAAWEAAGGAGTAPMVAAPRPAARMRSSSARASSIGDIQLLKRLGGANGADLLIEVMMTDAAGLEVPTGTQLTVKRLVRRSVQARRMAQVRRRQRSPHRRRHQLHRRHRRRRRADRHLRQRLRLWRRRRRPALSPRRRGCRQWRHRRRTGRRRRRRRPLDRRPRQRPADRRPRRGRDLRRCRQRRPVWRRRQRHRSRADAATTWSSAAPATTPSNSPAATAATSSSTIIRTIGSRSGPAATSGRRAIRATTSPARSPAPTVPMSARTWARSTSPICSGSAGSTTTTTAGRSTATTRPRPRRPGRR